MLDISVLQKNIGHEFKRLKLLECALTHRSVQSNNNERLEFLGDALLGAIIAEELFKQYPDAKEGELSRMRSNLVNGHALSQVARKLQLGKYINMSAGERRSGGHQRESILSNALEALIGAIYLDAGLNTARKALLRWFESMFDLAHQAPLKDPKTRLQEWLQAHRLEVPDYSVVAITGKQHEQCFAVSCKVMGVQGETEGQASSRRKAEQNAAEKFLMLIEMGEISV